MGNVILQRTEDGKYEVVETEANRAEMKQEGALVGNMESSTFGGIGATLDKITGMQIAGIPLGEAAVGGALAIVADRLIIARIDPQNKWGSWANLGMAFAIKKFGSKFLGTKTADAAALILTYEAVADWVTQAMNKVVPAKGTSCQVFKQTMAAHQSSAVNMASQVADDYYARAFGR